jgi:pSer/pThr/pTyr-binding forkhead associated (FHA) protein
MARLLVRTQGVETGLIELRLGANRLGRSAACDFPILHPTVSALHCEVVLMEDGLVIRDLESTNGTFVNGRPVREARLSAGQILRLGDVELLVETIEAKVTIPKFINTELPAPPVILSDGSLVCPRHPQARATHRCTGCFEVMCEPCIHRLRRKTSKTVLLLCPLCSQAVQPIGGAPKPKQKSLLARVGETVKMKFTRAMHLSSGSR